MSTPSAPTGAPSSATPSVSSSAPKSSAPSSAPAKSSAPSTPASAPSQSSASSSQPSQGSQGASVKSMSDIAAAKLAGDAPAQAPQQGGDAGDQKIAPVANETAEQKAFRIKVNGQDRELSPDQARRYAQLGFAADEKFQEATKLRQSAEALFKALKTDPMSVLTNPELGIDFRQLSEQYLASQLEREMLPPEQRELAELREFKATQEQAAKDAEKQKRTAAQQQEQEAHTKRAAEKYNKEISEALQTSELPRSPETLKRVAGLLLNARQKGYDLDTATAVEMVRESYQNEMKTLVGKMEPEAMIKFFGDEMVNRIRKYDLARLKRQLSGETQPEAAPAEQGAEQAAKPSTTSRRREPATSGGMRTGEWIENLRRKANITD